MAGLSGTSGFYPYGYTAPGKEAAVARFPPALAPAEYNKNELPKPRSAHKHTILATPGVVWPSTHKQDHWNNINPAPTLPVAPTRFNIEALPSANQKVDPIETPWSQGAAVKRVAAIAAGGVVEPAKNVVDIARTLVSTAVDPAQKDWWARRVNTLDQLEVISATRGLTAEETAIKERILKEMTEEAQKPSSLAINSTPYAAPGAPLTSNDIALSLQRVLVGNRRPRAATTTTATTAGLSSPMQSLTNVPLPATGISPFLASALNTSQTGQTPQNVSGTPPTPPTLPSFTTSQMQGGPPSPTLAPLALHFPPGTPQVGVVQRITSTEFGPASNDPAEVKLDPITNRRNLATLLAQKYGTRVPPEYEKDTWHDALSWFDSLVQEYTVPPGKKANFPKYILDVLDRASPKCDIFVAYLTPVINGTLTDYSLNKRTADGMLPKIAESSAKGEFYYHPNYRVV
jgi:hypothetical protein